MLKYLLLQGSRTQLPLEVDSSFNRSLLSIAVTVGHGGIKEKAFASSYWRAASEIRLVFPMNMYRK